LSFVIDGRTPARMMPAGARAEGSMPVHCIDFSPLTDRCIRGTTIAAAAARRY
jgi:hypothetical protein